MTYNIGLIVAGILAFIAYALIGEWLIMPYEDEFEITLFTTFFQGIGYLFMIGVANICYLLGPYVDRRINQEMNEQISRRLFMVGLVFSMILPFSIPVMLIGVYLIQYAN